MTEPTVESEECDVPCPLDCILTDWSDWSPCSTKCSPGFQSRRRNTVRGANFLGRPCGHLFETRHCKNSCTAYRWVFDQWGDCIPNAGNQPDCGPGKQQRNIWYLLRTLSHQTWWFFFLGARKHIHGSFQCQKPPVASVRVWSVLQIHETVPYTAPRIARTVIGLNGANAKRLSSTDKLI